MIDLRLGDCLNVMRGMTDDSVDAIVTDPPGGIHFLGKSWDHNKGSRDAWIAWLAIRLSESLRIAKPGARALVWAIPRTSHWTGMAIEDAGWIIEDRVAHLFGQGFPKAKSKLKPACEDWWIARKPSKNVPLLNIDDCRIAHDSESAKWVAKWSGHAGHPAGDFGTMSTVFGGNPAGRWPANVALTCCGEMPHLEGCPVAMLDEQSGTLRPGEIPARASRGLYKMSGQNTRPYHTDTPVESGHARVVLDSGGASRFFATFKAVVDQHGFSTYNQVGNQGGQSCGDESIGVGNTSAGKKPGSSDVNSPIDGSGSKPTGSSRKDMKSTTRTKTPSTTTCPTSNASLPSGTTIITSESGKTTRSLTGLSIDDANDATSISHLTASPSGKPAHTKDTAETAGRLIFASGEQPTGSDGTPIIESIERGIEVPRFFYCSKASPKDRGKGNTHPTVKSTELLSWLIRLISNPGDTILDPFAGSGTTGLACLNTGRHFIGIESDPVYFAIAERRLAAASNQTPLFAG
jgi:hypothetical protein